MDSLLAQLGTAFAVALLGGAHCVGMCGGLVGAMQLYRPATTGRTAFASIYHLGRISGYAAAGTLMGLAGVRIFVADVLPLQIALLALAGAFLAGIGMSLLGTGSWLRRLESLGGEVWNLVGPFARRLMPPKSRGAALAAGFLWGWIPCGTVYAVLPLALVSGSALHGALVMLAFGAGTLPNLIVLELGIGATVARKFAPVIRMRLRMVAGVLVLLFAASDLAHAALIAGAQSETLSWFSSICHASR